MTSFASNFCTIPTWDAAHVRQCGALFSPEYVSLHALNGPQVDMTPKNLGTLVHGSYADVFVHSHPQLLTGGGSLRAVSDSQAARLAGPTVPLEARGYTGMSTFMPSVDPLVHGDGGVHMAPATAVPYVCDGAASVRSTIQGVVDSRAYDLTLRKNHGRTLFDDAASLSAANTSHSS